jgi:hypothetical protein
MRKLLFTGVTTLKSELVRPKPLFPLRKGSANKIISLLEPELKLTWKELGLDGFLNPILSGEIENISSHEVSYDKISFVLTGKEIARLPRGTLGPGEKQAFYKGSIVLYAIT